MTLFTDMHLKKKRGSSVFGGKSAEFLKVKGMYIPFTFKNSGSYPVNPGRARKPLGFGQGVFRRALRITGFTDTV